MSIRNIIAGGIGFSPGSTRHIPTMGFTGVNSSLRWQGGASPVAQVSPYTFTGSWVIGDKVTVTIGSKAWTYTLTNATIATFLPLMVTAYNALSAASYPEMAEQTASSTSPVFSLTSDKAGRPFTATLTTSSGTGVITAGAGTGNSGPWNWDTGANWSSGATPDTGDTVYIDAGTDTIKYGLAQSHVTLAALHVHSNFAGTIGVPEFNADGTRYHENRPQYLQIGATLCNLGVGEGQGSQRIKIDFGTAQTTCNISNSGSGAETGLEAILIKGTHASNVFNITKGEVGFGVFGGDVYTLATLLQGFKSSVSSDAKVRLGAGGTVATVGKSGGKLEINCAIGTSLTQTAGTTTINGTGAVAQLTIQGGGVVLNTTGTVGGATVVSGDGFLDFDQDQRVKTVTNPIDVYGSGSIRDTYKVVTALVVDYNQMNVLGIGGNVRVTRGVPA